MKIRVDGQGTEIIFRLNDSQAAQDLYGQLPLTVNVENFGGDEKIFYPRKELRVSGARKADAKVGTLAYYAPWGDVVMFYKNFGTAAGLYELGSAVSGEGTIASLSGEVTLKKDNDDKKA